MATFEFEGRRVDIHDGDTVASALTRAGVTTFTRSLKYHRRRGVYCGTGDCPNCLLTVDGEPGVRSCCREASAGSSVRRATGWPNAERDVLAVADHLHAVMPVGFYYKIFTRPAWAWPIAEKVIRRATGVGSLPLRARPTPNSTRHVHCDVLVIGGGVAGLAAANASAARGARVLLVDEGRLGDKVPPGGARRRIDALARTADAAPGIEVLERHTAIGLYEGPLVPVVGPDETLEVEPGRIVVATGAVEHHAVFPGNDLPGVWLGRGAARMAGVHNVPPGRRAVVVAESAEMLEHLDVLRRAGTEIAAIAVSASLRSLVGQDVPVVEGGRVVRAEGRGHVAGVVLETPTGDRRFACDALILSLGFAPRDALLRMGAELPVSGAGDAVWPGCTTEQAEASGLEAAVGAVEPWAVADAPLGPEGVVCLCEDVGVRELHAAWAEGWTNAEILKRYTTTTMGPCQGAMCGRHLAAFTAARGGNPAAAARTTARPPARAVALQDLAGGVNEVIAKHTALHDVHVLHGAHLDWSGSWMRPFHYGDTAEEHRAVRERVSLMDVGTLGKFLVAGRDATELVDRVVPCRVRDLSPGGSRYMVALDEAGYVMDDGLVCATADDRYYVTSTSGGADRMEAWLRNWADRWDLHAHVLNQTAMLGAINVAGPLARELLARLSDDPLDARTLPYASHAEATVAGVACRVLRVGFVGELSFELHHPRSRGPQLWEALMREGADLGVRPHGLDALDVLRLEKGHPFLGQDTLPDDHPAKLGLAWAVSMDKPAFVGKVALERMASRPLERKLVGLRFDGQPRRGAPLSAGAQIVGRITSCARSYAVGASIGLGWIRSVGGEFPVRVRSNGTTGTVVPTPFYDPEGERLRA
jgi:sarcosine oxidase subunit alpha